MNEMLDRQTSLERWHELLSSRYVCEACLTRYFVPYEKCKACRTVGTIVPLPRNIELWADDDEQLREMIAHRRRPWEDLPEPVEGAPKGNYEI